MSLKKRIYEDYFKRNRLPEYRSLLKLAKENGYRMMSILDYSRNINNNFDSDTRILINRHDIDTSPKTARRFFEIEQEIYGQSGSATYYFRDSTIDVRLIKDIEQYGYETGYHYETIAYYAKSNHIHNKEAILSSISIIREQFLNELENYRARTGTKSATISSHGDFVNSILQVYNTEILMDAGVRKRANIECEAYDQIIDESPEMRLADQDLLERFTEEVKKCISNKNRTILILTHPRNWKVDVISNTKDNINRLIQGLLY